MKWINETWFLKDLFFPVIDILIVAYLIYKVYSIIEETRAIQALKGLLLLLLMTFLANIFYLETLSWLLKRVLGVAAIALIVLFQPELRRVLMKMGQGKWFSFYFREEKDHILSVAEAADLMSKRKIGALIVFEKDVGLKNYIETGTRLDSELSYELILSIFSKGAPLHDGAMILQHNQVIAAGCFLPLTERSDIKKSLGTRHRAAIGLSEETDAVVLIISE
ncbi:MAG: diadenylate cyclase CdaA, partial [Spirochaetes bacterium]|nr:diadenylate cyclase CdaA [Spirochaetota bacterium]